MEGAVQEGALAMVATGLDVGSLCKCARVCSRWRRYLLDRPQV